MSKVRLPGTHRAVSPEITWSRIEAELESFGITRVADVTRLDNIGIPVVLAVRPDSETLAVSQGKGATTLLARLSAVMESIELWHAERPPGERFAAAARDLALPYGLDELNYRWSGPGLERIDQEWVHAEPIGGGSPVPVPFDAVRLSYSGDHFWRPRLIETSSTGLASGNTFEESCLHAVYEAVERDALARSGPVGGGSRRRIAPKTVPGEYLQSLFALLDVAGVDHEVEWIPNRLRIPTFAAYVWSPLFPVVCAGAGTHMDWEVALSRAVTEAVQSRLTEITATRDDIPSDTDLLRDAGSASGVPAAADVPVALESVLDGYGGCFDDMERELRVVAERVHAATGRRALAVDLSTRPDLFQVVRVVCPGLAFTEGRTLSR